MHHNFKQFFQPFSGTGQVQIAEQTLQSGRPMIILCRSMAGNSVIGISAAFIDTGFVLRQVGQQSLCRRRLKRSTHQLYLLVVEFCRRLVRLPQQVFMTSYTLSPRNASAMGLYCLACACVNGFICSPHYGTKSNAKPRMSTVSPS